MHTSVRVSFLDLETTLRGNQYTLVFGNIENYVQSLNSQYRALHLLTIGQWQASSFTICSVLKHTLGRRGR
jgi:hypothetical protein